MSGVDKSRGASQERTRFAAEPAVGAGNGSSGALDTSSRSADPPAAEPGSTSGLTNGGDDHNHDAAAAKLDNKPKLPRPTAIQPCPRCGSTETKFCYYNNYNIKQPRYYCKGCQRYWTAGGTLREVPVGAGRRKSKIMRSYDGGDTLSAGTMSAGSIPVAITPDPAALSMAAVGMVGGAQAIAPLIPGMLPAAIPLPAAVVASLPFPVGDVTMLSSGGGARAVGNAAPAQPKGSLTKATANALFSDPVLPPNVYKSASRAAATASQHTRRSGATTEDTNNKDASDSDEEDGRQTKRKREDAPANSQGMRLIAATGAGGYPMASAEWYPVEWFRGAQHVQQAPQHAAAAMQMQYQAAAAAGYAAQQGIAMPGMWPMPQQMAGGWPMPRFPMPFNPMQQPGGGKGEGNERERQQQQPPQQQPAMSWPPHGAPWGPMMMPYGGMPPMPMPGMMMPPQPGGQQMQQQMQQQQQQQQMQQMRMNGFSMMLPPQPQMQPPPSMPPPPSSSTHPN